MQYGLDLDALQWLNAGNSIGLKLWIESLKVSDFQ